MATICPYCNIEVSESAIEADDGCCPECGSVVTVSKIFDDDIEEVEDDFDSDIDDDDDDLLEDDFDDDEFIDDEFDDLDFDDEDDLDD
ncbi:MAG: hypothetical protein PHS31_10405 [Victivallaceae bacterium]|nr:hypothetical protein [Victivallaceae bacterium]MDD4180518.1 hypothetical protein [Victivallaceae bacterium]